MTADQPHPAVSPAQVISLFASHVTAGDVDAVMALYEPEGTYINAAGEALRGGQVREHFLRLAALHPRMRGEAERVIEAGDVALVNNRWEFSGRQPDGPPVRSRGTSTLVLRRRIDGSWGILIDDPWGAGGAR